MVSPSGAYWVRVELERGAVEYLLGPDIVDIEQVADVSAVLTLLDGRSWELRVITAEALTAEIERWRLTAGPDNLMSYSDLFVVSARGLETMSRAIATAIASL
jgi:hypothetical protein